MRFINFLNEVENGYLNIDEISLCYVDKIAEDKYNIKIIYRVGEREIYRTINKTTFTYAKAIKIQTLLISLLANDTVKVIDIDEDSNITPRLHV